MPDQTIINKIIQAIREVIEPDKIILFGSHARGNARIDSDYDILVIKDIIEDEKQTLNRLYRQMIGIKASVDIILKSSEGIENSKKKTHFCYKRSPERGSCDLWVNHFRIKCIILFKLLF